MTTCITKIWFDGEKLMAQEIPESDIYVDEEDTLALLRRDVRTDIESAVLAKQVKAVPLFWYRPQKDGLYEGPIHANSIVGKKYREENPGRWRPLYTEPPTQAVEAMRDAYEAGWAECARWADRADLIHDMSSPAYITDRESALAAITPNHFADAGKPITKGAL